jgi:hypothetical protein
VFLENEEICLSELANYIIPKFNDLKGEISQTYSLLHPHRQREIQFVDDVSILDLEYNIICCE